MKLQPLVKIIVSSSISLILSAPGNPAFAQPGGHMPPTELRRLEIPSPGTSVPEAPELGAIPGPINGEPLSPPELGTAGTPTVDEPVTIVVGIEGTCKGCGVARRPRLIIPPETVNAQISAAVAHCRSQTISSGASHAEEHAVCRAPDGDIRFATRAACDKCCSTGSCE